eukprot:337596-Alexandrium_andersonii.AAC.1
MDSTPANPNCLCSRMTLCNSWWDVHTAGLPPGQQRITTTCEADKSTSTSTWPRGFNVTCPTYA